MFRCPQTVPFGRLPPFLPLELEGHPTQLPEYFALFLRSPATKRSSGPPPTSPAAN